HPRTIGWPHRANRSMVPKAPNSGGVMYSPVFGVHLGCRRHRLAMVPRRTELGFGPKGIVASGRKPSRFGAVLRRFGLGIRRNGAVVGQRCGGPSDAGSQIAALFGKTVAAIHRT